MPLVTIDHVYPNQPYFQTGQVLTSNEPSVNFIIICQLYIRVDYVLGKERYEKCHKIILHHSCMAFIL